MRNPLKKTNYSKFIKQALDAVFKNIPEGYEVRNLRLSIDPDYQYSNVDYHLDKIEESK